jgi:hypothetical protein
MSAEEIQELESQKQPATECLLVLSSAGVAFKTIRKSQN